VRFSQRSDVEFGNLLLVLAVEMIVLLVDGHPGPETHEEVLEVSPGRGAHRLLGGARELGQAVHKCPVTLTQLVRAAGALTPPVTNTIWRASVAFPLVRHEVREVVLQSHAGGRGVAPVMHLTASVDRVHGVAGAEEAAVAAVALVDQGVAARPTLDHRVEVPGGSLGRIVRQAFILFEYVIFMMSN